MAEIEIPNFRVFQKWQIKSYKNFTTKIKHCKSLTEHLLCYQVLFFIDAELKEPESFYNFAIEIATAVADEYFDRWESGRGLYDKWDSYESWIPRVTAETMRRMVPGLMEKAPCHFEDGSVLFQNIIARYNTIKGENS